MPVLGRVRMLRSWGGVMDMSMDGSPIIDQTPLDRPLSQCRLVLWRLQGDAGLRLVLRPSDRARTSRIPSPPPIASIASQRGLVIDEKGVGAQPNLH